jgi:putative restriction endonuclease
MKAYVAITDGNWFRYLSALPGIDEVNFWQPGGSHAFRALNPGEPFLFKLHSPDNYIVGGGFFAYSTILPCSLAWSTFVNKNGASSLIEMRERIEQYRRTAPTGQDYHIGCILLEQPFFFSRNNWIPVPEDWSISIQQGKRYDLSAGLGKQLWERVQQRLFTMPSLIKEETVVSEPTTRYGEPQIILPRLGQGSFRIIVTDVYNRRCAVTLERTLPALEAGHIKPFAQDGPHDIRNGILLRSDLHRLFDQGYVTITNDYHFEVSKKIREEFENGRDYYALNGNKLNVPAKPAYRPALEFITWHNENIYLG